MTKNFIRPTSKAGNIMDALQKLYYGRITNTVTSFSVVRPISVLVTVTRSKRKIKPVHCCDGHTIMTMNNKYASTHNACFLWKAVASSGLMYDLDFDDKINPAADQVFWRQGGVKILSTKEFTVPVGTVLDFSDGLNGKDFTISQNATRTCGCGESFAV